MIDAASPLRRVAVIGTGIMGSHVARRLAQAGFEVCAWNRSPAKAEPLRQHGVRVAESVEVALAHCDAAIVLLSTGAVIDDVLFGTSGGKPAAYALRPGSLFIVMSSIAVETARAQAADIAPRGIRYVDAPVSGGEPGARDGTLAIMAGGAPDDVARAEPVFAALGTLTRLGPVGSGQLAKLANQIIVGGTLIAIAEALTLIERGGADPAAARQAWLGGFADSKVLRVLGERMVNGDFTPGSPAAYQLKDMRAASALALGFGLRLEQLASGIERFAGLEASGEVERDVSIVIREVARAAWREEDHP